MKITLLIVLIIVNLTVFFTMKSAIKPNKNILFGVTLPKEKLKDKETLEVVNMYKKEMNKYIVISIFLGLLTFKINKTSLQIVYMLIWTFVVCGVVINLPYKNMNKKLHEIKKKNNWIVEKDEDKYWINGYKYYNENDKSTIVSSRYGYSMTYNLATKRGKIINYGILIPVSIMVVGICILLIIMDFSNPTINIYQQSNKISIDYPMYNYDFKIDEIESVDLVEDININAKTNGIATNDYDRGNFSVEKYGRSKVYIYKKIKTYIVIKTKDDYVIYNENNKKDTLKIYNEIKKLLD